VIVAASSDLPGLEMMAADFFAGAMFRLAMLKVELYRNSR
jgi:hypothetical protein